MAAKLACVMALLIAPCAYAAPCFATAEAAAHNDASALTADAGWRVHDRSFDVATGAEIVRVARCDDASAPWRTVAVGFAPHVEKPLIIAGQRVVVRVSGQSMQYANSAVALESGAAGALIRIEMANALHPELPGRIVQAAVLTKGEVGWQW